MTDTDHDSYIKRYFDLIHKALSTTLEFEGQFTPEQIENDDKKVIEYYLKDCARHAVSANLSPEECSVIFCGRINRLANRDKREWTEVTERIKENLSVLGKGYVSELYKLQKQIELQCA